MTARLAVLASGGGSNLQAIIDYFDRMGSDRSTTVVLVASNRGQSGALQRARACEIAAVHIQSDDDGRSLDAVLRAHDVDLIALAGYLRLVAPEIVRRFRGRILNVHPALLPAFGGQGMYGEHVHRAVIEAGVRVSGATVHFIDERYDQGAIVAQWPVPVLHDDTPEALAARVLRIEHTLFPRAIDAVASGRVWLDADGRVRGPAVALAEDYALTTDLADVERDLDELLRGDELVPSRSPRRT